MAYKALSECVKRQKQSCLKHTKMHDTVNAYQREQGKPIEECKGARKIAEEHSIKKQWTTIIKQYNGGCVVNIPIYSRFSSFIIYSLNYFPDIFSIYLFKAYYLEVTDIFLYFSH